MLIQYKGFREPHRDATYETGEWTIGMVKDVPDAIALKMLKHPDVYAMADEAPSVVEQVLIRDKPATDEDQNARDAIAAMQEKDAVAHYALVNFGMKIPKTLTLDNMKQRAVQLVDQYGVV